jgi:hypothetical protein
MKSKPKEVKKAEMPPKMHKSKVKSAAHKALGGLYKK